MNKFARIVPASRGVRSAALASVAALAASAHAAMPAGVETAISEVQTNAVSIATTVLLAVVAVFAIKFIRKGL